MAFRRLFSFSPLVPWLINAAAPKTVIITSDAGAVLDDTWAIAYILQDPDVEVKLVVSDTRDTHGKANFLCRTLLSLGRPDIPVVAGVPTSPKFVYDSWKQCCNGTCAEVGCEDGFFIGPAAPWPPAPSEACEQVAELDGIRAMAEVVQGAEGIVDVLALAPLTNLGAFVRRYPALVPRVRVTGMAGSIDVGYLPSGDYSTDDGPSAECNIATDPDAARDVLSAPWAGLSLAPLDTTRSLQIVGPLYERLLAARETQLPSETIISQYETQIKPCHALGVWCPANGRYDTPQNASSTLYDLQAAFMLSVGADPSDGHGLHIETLRLSVNASSFTVRDDIAGHPVNVSLKWLDGGVESFYEHVVQRLTGAAPTIV